MESDWITSGGDEPLENQDDNQQDDSQQDDSLHFSDDSTDDNQEDVSQEQKSVSDDPEKAGILDDLRNTRAELRAMRREQQEREHLLAARLQQLTERYGSQAESVGDEAPDRNEDPVGYLIWQQEQSAKQNTAAIQQMQQQVAQTQDQNQFAAVAQRARELEKSFIETKGVEREAYDKTLDVFRNMISTTLNLQGYNEAQIPNLVSTVEYNVIQNALRNGVNPAEQIYDLVNNSPFAPKIEKTSGNGGQGFDRMRKGKDAAVSLSKARGGTAKRRITLDDLATMSPDQFSKILKNPRYWETINTQGYVDI